jgi:hypothetical protein
VARAHRRSTAELSDLTERARASLAAPDAPTTLGELAARLEVPCDRALAETVVDRRLKGDALRFALKARRGAAGVAPDEPVYARAALDDAALAHVLEFLLRRARGASTAFSPSDLAKKLRGNDKSPRVKWLRASLQAALEDDTLPPGFGAVRRNAAWVLFRLEDLRSSGRARPRRAETTGAPRRDVEGRDFADAFERAFAELAQAGRGLNFVKLHALRAALPGYDRAAFDAGLRELRLAGRFALDPAEGTHDRLTDEERASGITEGGSRLVYCRRVG